jgi:hypothetical protein
VSECTAEAAEPRRTRLLALIDAERVGSGAMK